MSDLGLSISELERLAEETPGLADVVTILLDRVERRGGRLPARVTLAMTPAVATALGHIFSARAVTVIDGERARLELGAFLRDRGAGAEGAVVRALYALVRRTPRDPDADARTLRRDLERALVDLEPDARTAAARALLRAERARLATGDSPLLERAASPRAGAAAGARFVAELVRCVDAVVEHRESAAEPVRVQVFSARVLGSSKALRRGTELHRAVSEALLAHDAGTRDAMLEAGFPLVPSFARHHALGLSGVLYDEAASSVLCFGPIIYAKRSAPGERFDHVARHARLGESSRILLQQLRDAEIARPAARRITLLENLATYLDYVDACVEEGDLDREIVVCSGGQASFAVIALLRRLAAHGLPARHAGDLDRSGILILRSLAKRSGAPVAPAFMDAATHARFADRGRPITADERARLDAFVRTDLADAPGHDLARAILASGAWIEQEAFFDEILADLRQTGS